ncbi:DNRLRE domain-containing protein [Paenibacillus sp. MMO-177]|uniref:DNRLRE domain-containing protein n=1 Tax=Paenibacillus sp. MMO-177 TaxID=3081289 RepID=UPI0030173055
MYQKRFTFKILCVFLSIVLIATTIDQQTTFAANSQDQTSVKGDEQKSTSQREKKRQELSNLRKEKSRTYFNEDGTYTTEISQIPINYWDKNSNSWLPISTKLKSDSKKAFNDYNSFKTSLNKKYSKNSALLEITDEKYKLSLNPKIDTVPNGEGTVSENSVNYIDFYSDDSDLKYSLGNDRVKEEIILKKKPGKNNLIYSFSLELQGLNYKQEENGSITLYDPVTNQKMYYIQQPYMYDSFIPEGYSQAANVSSFPEEALSYDIHYEVKEENGSLFVDVIPNQDWLNDNDRVYPVTIDPTIVKFQPNSSLQDTNIRSAFPTQTGPTESTLGVGLYKDTTQTNVIRSLIKFDVSALPAGAAILTADLNLWLAAVSNNTDIGVTLHGMTTAWTETDSSWTKATSTVSWTKQGGDFNTSQLYTQNVSSLTDLSVNYRWALSPTTIETWINDSTRNKGFLLKSNSETVNSYKKFISSDDTVNVNYTPLLSVTYYPASRLGLEDYWTYDNHSLTNGTSYTNLGTGNNVIQYTDYSLDEKGDTQLDLTRTYNSKAVETSPLGYGWSFTGSDTVVEATGAGIILYTDSDGTSHKFDYDSTKGYYVSPAGKYLKIEKIKEDQVIKGYKITDKYGYITYFDQPKADLQSSYIKARISYEQDVRGNRITYNYDTNGKLLSISDQANRAITFSYGSDGLIDYAMLDGRKTDYTYSNGKLIYVDQYLIDGSYNRTIYQYTGNYIKNVIDPKNRKTTFTYNGELLEKLQEPSTDDTGEDLTTRPGTSYDYDLTNRTATITDPLNHTIKYYMNDNYSPTRIVDASNNETNIKMDENYNPIEITDDLGTTIQTFDSNGNLLTSIDPESHKNSLFYDQYSNLIKQIDGEDNVIQYFYDENGNLDYVIDANNKKTDYLFDEFGNLLQTEYPNHTIESYDISNNVKTIKDAAGNITTTTYDTIGNIISQTNGNGYKTLFDYDNQNRLKKVTDSKNNVFNYNYDGSGNLSEIIDPDNNSTKYFYNGQNQLTKVTNAFGQSIINQYDAKGNLSGIVTANGNIISNSYDELDQLKETKINNILKWNFNFDANGNLRSVMTDGALSKVLDYYKNGSVKTSTDRGQVFNYTYTNVDYLDTLSYVIGTKTTTINYDYSNNNNVSKISNNGSLFAQFEYNDLDSISKINRLNGTSTEISYGSGNQIENYADMKLDGTPINNFVYKYDSNMNITQIESAASGKSSYTYDELNQLKSETLEDGTITTYDYDKRGNRLSKTVNNGQDDSRVTNYFYNDLNQLTKVGDTEFTYDNDGNLKNDGVRSYYYNELDQLIEIKDANGQSIFKAQYDESGKRVRTESNNEVVNYFYDGENVVLETDANNNVIREYTWDMARRPVTMSMDGITYFYHLNAHGDVVSMTDMAGNIVASYTYDAWGNLLSSNGVIANSNPYRYASYRFDNNTNLYYLTTRYYDANNGRFITKDTFQGLLDDPLSLNLYSYTKNNPINSIDPDGHLSFAYRYDVGWGTYAAFRIGLSYVRVSAVLTVGGVILQVGKAYVGSIFSVVDSLINKTMRGASRYLGKAWIFIHQQITNYLIKILGKQTMGTLHGILYRKIFGFTKTFYF